jgi:hypothetical protein
MPYTDKSKNAEAQRRFYANNKEYFLQKNRKQRKRKADYLKEIKEKNPCADCGVRYPHYIMEFDHISEKTTNIITALSWNQIYTEIEKCEIVCANCHSKRTWERRSNAQVAE